MQIISIKQSRIPNRVFVKFDNATYLPFSLDDIVTLGLVKGQSVDDSTYKNLVNTSLTYLLYAYALNQISLSAKNEFVLTKKSKAKLSFYLKKYQLDKSLIDSDLIPSVIAKIKSQNLINDAQFILSYIQSHPRKSRREIEYLLHSQGVDTGAINTSWFSDDSELEKIKKLIGKKIKSRDDLSDNKTKNKVMGYLIRKGFPLSLVKVAIDEYSSSQ